MSEYSGLNLYRSLSEKIVSFLGCSMESTHTLIAGWAQENNNNIYVVAGMYKRTMDIDISSLTPADKQMNIL